jgi:hypothetical protein
MDIVSIEKIKYVMKNTYKTESNTQVLPENIRY